MFKSCAGMGWRPDVPNEVRQTTVGLREPPQTEEHPVLEYIGALAEQLAHTARREGEEPLARLLETAVAMAARPDGGARRPRSI